MTPFIVFLCGWWTGALMTGVVIMFFAGARGPGLREDAEVPR